MIKTKFYKKNVTYHTIDLFLVLIVCIFFKKDERFFPLKKAIAFN